MSPKPRGGAKGEDNTGGSDPSFKKIERGIDAIDRLRVEMRKAGMTACAEALDNAFAHCLRDYMTLKETDASPPVSSEGEDDKTLN